MKTHADKTQKNKGKSVANDPVKKQDGSDPAFQFADKRPEAIARKELQGELNDNPRVQQLKALQETMYGSPRTQQALQFQAQLQANPHKTAQRDKVEEEEEKPIQGKSDSVQRKENNTGLPDNLKTGIEDLSGHSMNDVKVHYNSDKPKQLQAHAYAQGTDIHIAPGQEKHLPHEAWHVVQQKQGRVKPTMQLKDKININDDVGLEQEADVMGAKSLTSIKPTGVTQKKDYKSSVAQLEPEKEGYSSEQEELTDLADELKKNKSQIKSLSEGEVEEAIIKINQLVHSGDKSAISKGLSIVKEEAGKAQKPDTSKSGEETAQLSGWRFAGAIVGGVLGAIAGALIGAAIGSTAGPVGTIVGAVGGGILGLAGGGVGGWKTGKKKDDVNRLMAAGATQPQAVQLLNFESNAQTLVNQIQNINNNNVAHLIQLYAHATSAQITTLLGHETNGVTLYNHLNTEANHDAARIIQLYAAGFTSVHITAMLGVQANAATLLNFLNSPLAQLLNNGNKVRLVQLNNVPLVTLMDNLLGRRNFVLSGQAGRNVLRFQGGTWLNAQVDCIAVFGALGPNKIRGVVMAPNGQQKELYRIMSNGVAVILRSWSSENHVLATIEIQDGPVYEFKYQ